jgi:ectoine hydroxylase-related dioxygenase (phytanoyl-CoA dioxygenase family)
MLVSESISNQFKTQGFVILREVFSQEEVKQWHDEVNRLLALSEIIHPDNLRTRFCWVERGTMQLQKFHPVCDISPIFMDVANDYRLTEVVDILLDGLPMLFSNKLIFQFPGQLGYSIHQDANWWSPLPYQDMLSVMVAINNADRENGCLELFPGYHDQLIQQGGKSWYLPNSSVDKLQVVYGETSAGDVIIFHSLTPHKSSQNRSTRSRTQLYLSYSLAKYGNLQDQFIQHYRSYMKQSVPELFQERLFFK